MMNINSKESSSKRFIMKNQMCTHSRAKEWCTNTLGITCSVQAKDKLEGTSSLLLDALINKM